VPIRSPNGSTQDGTEAERLPVTVICGFVAAGKSTLVRKVVAAWSGGRMAVLVHDRSDAALNSDLCGKHHVEVFQLGEVLAELVQRCVGCSLRESVTRAITAIADMRRFDRLLVECSGLVEPVMVAEIFNDAWESQEPLSAKARLDHLITVVDARTVWDDMHSGDDLRTRGVSCGKDDRRTLSELVVEQVEYATLLVMSHTKGLARGTWTRVRDLLTTLNPEATILSLDEESDLGEQILSERASGSLPISFQPGWVKLIQRAPMPKLRSSHWTMGVFQATCPFHPERLWDFIESDWPGILRCKGYFWIASQPERCFSWEQTAGVRHFECIGNWWVATSRDQWPTDSSFETQLKQNWSVEFGDRRQIFGWIGYRLDAAAWRHRLQSCLLTPAEVLEGQTDWLQFDDPFARAMHHAASLQDDTESE